jgi:hypothetical protein
MSVISVISFFVFCCVISSLILFFAMNLFVMILTCSIHSSCHSVNISHFNIFSADLFINLIASFFSFSKKLFTRLKCDHESFNIIDFLSCLLFDSIISKYFKILSNLSFKNVKKICLILIKLHKMKNHLNKQLCMLEYVYHND